MSTINPVIVVTYSPAFEYLQHIGPRSNLGKVQSSLTELESACRVLGLGREWSEAASAVEEAVEVCTADSGAERDEKIDAREAAEGAVEDLVTELEARL